jgi:hypothetical protein
MSRTTRKQSGNRYWRDAHRSTSNWIRMDWQKVFEEGNWQWFVSHKAGAEGWDLIEEDIQKDIIRFERKDGYCSMTGMKSSIKWHSNMMVRSCNKRELQKVLKDPYNYEYNRDHDLRKRGICWFYD